MKLALRIATALALIGACSVSPAAAVEFGAPDYSNWMSRPGPVICDWQYPSYWRACPTPDTPPKPEPASVPTVKGKVKKG